MPHRQPAPKAKKAIWAYAYQIVPPQGEDRLAALKFILDHQQAEARSRARTWESRLVTEEQVTHILVVSDSPEQNLESNRCLEAELRSLKLKFSVTAAMAVTDGDDEAEESF